MAAEPDDIDKVHLIRSLMNEYENRFIKCVLVKKLGISEEELKDMRTKYLMFCPEIYPDDDPLTPDALEFLRNETRPALCPCCIKKTKRKPKSKK